MVTDLYTGKDEYDHPNDGDPKDFFALGDKLLFIGTTPEYGPELMVSDGTESGTKVLRDFEPGPDDGLFRLKDPVELNGQAYFLGNDTLWTTDGTPEGTQAVFAKPEGANYDLVKYDNRIVLEGDSKLWFMDGTEDGTEVLNLLSDIGIYRPRNMIVYDGLLYFTATDDTQLKSGTLGRELWKTDGTVEGTVLVKDIYSGSRNSNPEELTVINDKLYFSARDRHHARELWVTNGKPERSAEVDFENLEPIDFPGVELEVEFTELDTTINLSVLRDEETDRTQLSLPDSLDLAVPGHWNISTDTTVNFSADLCFSLDGLMNTEVDLGHLKVIKRSSDDEPWTELIVSVYEYSNDSDLICATGVQSFSDFAIVSSNETTSLQKIDENSPRSFTLESAYPNPFNPTTTIRYSVPQTAAVSLTVFDMLGREVARLLDKRQQAGSYSIRFDASNLSSGTYIYRLKAGDMVKTQKMTLVK
jgi:ELWxxDGT repeat protein